MLEAKLEAAATLKRLLEGILSHILVFIVGTKFWNRAAIKELVTDANFQCNDEGIVSRRLSFP